MQAARHLIKGSVAASSVGASAAALLPSSAECRAATAASELAPDVTVKTVQHECASALDCRNSLDGWTSTEVLADGNFTFQEVEEAIHVLGMHDACESEASMREILAMSTGRLQPDIGAGSCVSSRESDTESVTSYGSDAVQSIKNSWQTMPLGAPSQLSITVEKLLNNSVVQQAVSNALNGIPEFNALLEADGGKPIPDESVPSVMPTPSLLLPAVADLGRYYEAPPLSEHNALQKALAALKQTLADAGRSLASFFDDIASSLRRMLGFDTILITDATCSSSDSKPSDSNDGRRRATWKGAVFTLAICVFTLVVFKRRHILRFC